MNISEQPWLVTDKAADRLKQTFLQHRAKAVIACEEDCWCWDVASLLTCFDYERLWSRSAAVGYRQDGTLLEAVKLMWYLYWTDEDRPADGLLEILAIDQCEAIALGTKSMKEKAALGLGPENWRFEYVGLYRR